MSIITNEKSVFFSIGEELYESILILAKLWLILSVMLSFAYKILNSIINFTIRTITK